VRFGMGQCRYAAGDVYEGPWVSGRREGANGRQVYASGDEYVGEWQAGRREGRGTHRFANGDVYEVRCFRIFLVLLFC
jgi:1-phosphatidylinositol-4-phosphate 5-kinase